MCNGLVRRRKLFLETAGVCNLSSKTLLCCSFNYLLICDSSGFVCFNCVYFVTQKSEKNTAVCCAFNSASATVEIPQFLPSTLSFLEVLFLTVLSYFNICLRNTRHNKINERSSKYHS